MYNVQNFDSLVEAHYQPLFRFAVSLCGKLDRALELTQHTFCLALNRQAYLQAPEKVKHWLFTLLFREFLKEERTQGAARQAMGRPRLENTLLSRRSELRGPAFLFHELGFSFSQIAEYLGLSIETVLQQLARGRSVFKPGFNESAVRPSRKRTARLRARVRRISHRCH